MAFPHLILGSEKDTYETGAGQLYPLGQKLVTPDGAIFRYTLMGGTTGVANKAYQSETRNTGWTDEALATAVAVGDTSMLFKDNGAAFAANLFQGGTVTIDETDDLGHVYRIKSNNASGGTAEARLYFEDGVTIQVAVAVAAANVASVMKNPWRDVVITPVTTPTAITAGVPRVVIASAAFGWVQTSGVASCLVDSTWVLGNPLTVGAATAGGLMPSAAATDATTAYAMRVGVDADFGHCYLLID